MSSYIPPLSSLSTHLSQTTSRYTSALRQRLPTTSTSESDDVYITDPDASHLSRVLRAYYKEKSKPLPPWLGPDPRDREKHQVADNEGGAGGYLGSLRRSAVAATSSSSGGGGGRGGTAAAPNRGSGGGGGLGDIWGEGGSQQPQQAEGSLRPGGELSE
ncbi:MAG: hypothetical protein L6R40_002889 [Gallowayella cf. fulva]|nr:MAG: hypothetical protein L6R40_002889 [Xanthomendoza cf. fulva]